MDTKAVRSCLINHCFSYFAAVIGGGTIAAMIQAVRQNAGMLRSANRKNVNKDMLVRGSGTINAPIEGGSFRSEQERLAFLAKLAAEKRQADRVLYAFLAIASLLLVVFLIWILA